MRQEDLLVEVRDKTLTRVGAIPADLLTMDAEDVHNNVGTWKLQINAEHPLAAVLSTPGAGIIVTGPTDVLFSGPVTKTETAVTATDPLGTLTVEGVDDTIILSDMLAWPDPANGNADTQNFAYDERTGPAETLMHTYVNVNCGPGAPSNRRRAGLIMGTNSARGTSVSKAARFQQLGELCKELAEPAGLGFRVVQRGANLVFETYAVQDRTKEARLGVVNNTLAGQRVSVSTPAKTRVIVGGDGDGSNRLFVGVDSADSLAAEADWGRRIESFVDERSSTDTAELTQKGTEALADGGTTVKAAQAVPMEDSALDFGVDWFLGDKVSVIVGGSEMAAVVTSMVLKVDSDGYRLGAVLGDPTPLDAAAAEAKAAKELESRVSSLERTAEATPAGPREVASGALTQASAPDDWPEGASLMFLNSTQSSAGGWDFAGKVGYVTTRRFANGDAAQTFTRVHASATPHEEWVRGGNRASGFGPWRQVSWDSQLTAANYTQASLPTAYPHGDSWVVLDTTQASAGGWAFATAGYGVLRTFRNPAGTYAHQRWSRLSTTDGTQEWERSGSDADGWGAWRQVGFDGQVTAASITQSSPPSSYPGGLSTCIMTNDESMGWDFGGSGRYCLLQTYRPDGGSYATQHATHFNSTKAREWVRVGSNAYGWAPWRPLAFEDSRARGVIAMQTLATSAYVGDTSTLIYSQQFTAEAGRCYKVVLRIAAIDTDGTGDNSTVRYAKQGAYTTVRWAAGSTVSTTGTLVGDAFSTTFDDDSNTATGLDINCYINNPPAGLITVGVTLNSRRAAATYGMVRYLPGSLSQLVIEDAGAAI
ncbi:siphovirus ReqiPepy6 Gp37-like family protein [Streptomyces sp. AC558_RSS880]|uniref:siphovirus ReqiPepy6 Gp37-like family protein n=1 Tax=Streptomyces sp. AC558_RSS880 TaxID=2823687 RepID=UPI0027E40E8C|nr:siphovirus ReqiPepy6 Gp37-like family protein [Streptomyces sp. AC558_RSS880]